MEGIKDCSGQARAVFAQGAVLSCKLVTGDIYLLQVSAVCPAPVAGQFFMLRAVISGVLLGRPISVFHAEKKGGETVLHFLIMKKGAGTRELCALKEGDGITLLGPLGNAFPRPCAHDAAGKQKVCIAGGGIGVAPVARFAETLEDKSYDFFAAFKSGTYGLEHIAPDKLVITTDDGSAGIKGMISAGITEETLRQAGYSAVYACGPEPMLAYMKTIAEAAGVVCYISMERRMACGVGVCLGCTVPILSSHASGSVTSGTNSVTDDEGDNGAHLYKDSNNGQTGGSSGGDNLANVRLVRCCKDGPVFDSRVIDMSTLHTAGGTRGERRPLASESNLSMDFRGIRFSNPIIASSGTFGFATEYQSVFDVNRLGGIASKGVTLEPRQGNSGRRLWETPSGLLNSIGLQNPGIKHFIEHELPGMLALKPVTIVNLSGSTLESYIEGARLLDATSAPVIELNISCPNVATGGAAWGMTCMGAEQAVGAVRAITKKPLIVKLTPQSRELTDVALRCIKAGADGISLCNSFQGVAIDIESGKPVFDKVKAGFGGPAVRPIAMRLVWEVCEAIDTLPKAERVPVFAIGGVEKWQDAVEFIMAGASFVEVGTAKFSNPLCMLEIIDGLALFMQRKGYTSIEDMRGAARR